MSRVIAAFAQFFNGEGEPLSNGWLRFLQSQSVNTHKDTFADANQTIANANPLQLDAEGRCPNVFGHGIYKVILYEDNPVVHQPGTMIQTFDPVVADYQSEGAGGNFAEWDAGTIYQVGQIVLFNGLYYRSFVANNVGNAPDISVDAWERIDFLRFWNTDVTYGLDDIAIYGSQLYFSLAAGNVGNVPNTSPAWWDPVGSGTILLDWQESGTTFQPVVSGYDLGSITNLIGNIYQQDSGVHYFGDDQDGKIYHDGTNFYIVDETSQLILQTAFNILFNTAGATRWTIYSNGNFFPGDDGLSDIGNTSNHIRHTYHGDNGNSYYGLSEDGRIYHDGTNFYLVETNTHLVLQAASNILFQTGGGTTRWTINSAGILFPATTATYDIGTTALTVRHIYSGDSCVHYFGSDQDANIQHTGTYFQFFNNTGDTYFGSQGANRLILVTSNIARWYIDANGNFYPQAAYTIGSTTNLIGNIYQGNDNYHYFGSSQDSYCFHDGTGNYFYLVNTTGNIAFRSTTGIIIFQTGGANDRWTIDTSGNLIPQTATALNIGSTANEIGNIYSGDDAYHYFGADQDAQIRHNGTDFYIRTSTGNFYLGTLTTSNLIFLINGAAVWNFDTSGHLVPGVSTTYNLGSITYEINNIYQGDSGTHYFGSDQDASIYHDGSAFYVYSSAGDMYIGTTASNTLTLRTNSIDRWAITPTGSSFYPAVNNTYDIGSTIFRVKTIYAVNALNTSDLRLKTDIKDNKLGLDFIKTLRTVSFKLKEAEQDRTRYGLIAQEVDTILKSFTLGYEDFSGIHYDQENDLWDMDYLQYIAPLIKAVQQLNDKTEKLLKQVEVLSNG